MTVKDRNCKRLCLGLAYVVFACLLVLTSCTTPASSPATGPETTTYTAQWAEGQVSAYLNSLAKSPDAIRYVAEMNSNGYFESIFSQSEVDQDFGGHKYSGWQVYYRPTGIPSKEYWGNLNWAVCKDGYVTEGSSGALRLKADLLELNEQPFASLIEPQ